VEKLAQQQAYQHGILVFNKKKGDSKKKKRSKKRKNVLKYGKLKEFPTFQHDKQTTIVYSLSLEKCKPITGLK
jgi:hypothetical protein